MSLTAALAELLIARFKKGIDRKARKSAEMLFRDGIAVACAGVGEAGPRIVRGLADTSGAAPAATMIGNPRRTSVAEAARANGVAMHVLDWEPMWNPANHSLSTTLPAVLALAEAQARRAGPFRTRVFEVTGERMLTALALGIETQARMRIASGFMEPGEFKFHPPGHVGPLGAAAAAGLLLGLDAGQLKHAIGIAASRAGTIQANVGSMTKAMHCGEPAAAGIESALLARAGFTADADALGSPIGYGRAFFGDRFNPRKLVAEKDVLHIVEPGPAYKIFPSQYGTHFVITAALEARARLKEGSRIAAVQVTTPVMPYIDRPEPASGLAGKFSFQYTVAAALLDGDVTPASFTDARRFAPDMVDMLKRIKVVQDASIQGRFDRMRVKLEVRPADGARVAATCKGPPGIWGNPVDPKRIQRKHEQCLATFAEGRALETLKGLLAAPAALDGRSLVKLMDTLGGAAAEPAKTAAVGMTRAVRRVRAKSRGMIPARRRPQRS